MTGKKGGNTVPVVPVGTPQTLPPPGTVNVYVVTRPLGGRSGVKKGWNHSFILVQNENNQFVYYSGQDDHDRLTVSVGAWGMGLEPFYDTNYGFKLVGNFPKNRAQVELDAVVDRTNGAQAVYGAGNNCHSVSTGRIWDWAKNQPTPPTLIGQGKNVNGASNEHSTRDRWKSR